MKNCQNNPAYQTLAKNAEKLLERHFLSGKLFFIRSNLEQRYGVQKYHGSITEKRSSMYINYYIGRNSGRCCMQQSLNDLGKI